MSGGCGFPFHRERGPNGTVRDGGSGRCEHCFGAFEMRFVGRFRAGIPPLQGSIDDGLREVLRRGRSRFSCGFLFFVLTKGMSVIGPRPALPSEVKTYTTYQRQRLLVRGGLSCYWQTRRNRDTISFEEWIDLDLCKRTTPARPLPAQIH